MHVLHCGAPVSLSHSLLDQCTKNMTPQLAQTVHYRNPSFRAPLMETSMLGKRHRVQQTGKAFRRTSLLCLRRRKMGEPVETEKHWLLCTTPQIVFTVSTCKKVQQVISRRSASRSNSRKMRLNLRAEITHRSLASNAKTRHLQEEPTAFQFAAAQAGIKENLHQSFYIIRPVCN